MKVMPIKISNYPANMARFNFGTQHVGFTSPFTLISTRLQIDTN